MKKHYVVNVDGMLQNIYSINTENANKLKRKKFGKDVDGVYPYVTVGDFLKNKNRKIPYEKHRVCVLTSATFLEIKEDHREYYIVEDCFTKEKGTIQKVDLYGSYSSYFPLQQDSESWIKQPGNEWDVQKHFPVGTSVFCEALQKDLLIQKYIVSYLSVFCIASDSIGQCYVFQDPRPDLFMSLELRQTKVYGVFYNHRNNLAMEEFPLYWKTTLDTMEQDCFFVKDLSNVFGKNYLYLAEIKRECFVSSLRSYIYPFDVAFPCDVTVFSSMFQRDTYNGFLYLTRDKERAKQFFEQKKQSFLNAIDKEIAKLTEKKTELALISAFSEEEKAIRG